MARQLEQPFRCRELDDLTRQLLFAPPAKRAQQLLRAEALHDQIDNEKNYPFDFLNFRITGYHSESDDVAVLAGDAVQPDLRLMIDRLSKSLSIEANADNPAASAESLAAELSVSTKTIARWRKKGLRWRWVIDAESTKPRVGFTPAAVAYFLSGRETEVARAASFSQMDSSDRRRLLERARRLAESTEASLNRIAAHLAKKTGRALETIRQQLQQHDKQHPLDPIFVDRREPLTARQRAAIHRQLSRGGSATRLSRSWRRSRATIYRASLQHRAARLMRLPLWYQTSPMFDRDDAAEVILAGLTMAELMASVDTDPRPPAGDDLPESIRMLFVRPAPDPDLIRRAYVAMHFLKWRIERGRRDIDEHHPRTSELNAVEADVHRAGELRNMLIRLHLPVVLASVRAQSLHEGRQGPHLVLQLLAAGLPLLRDSVATHDPWRDRPFAQLLRWRLMRHYAHESDHVGRAQRRLTDMDVLDALRAGVKAFRPMDDTAVNMTDRETEGDTAGETESEIEDAAQREPSP